MRFKVPNQTEGEIIITGSDLVAHHYPVAGDGTIDVGNELMAWHIATTMEGVVAVAQGDVAGPDQADQSPAPWDQPSDQAVPIPSDLAEVADNHEGE